ncbi:MAG: DUF1211 domain-containing protein [bacterium]|nr:DUF1211 domain-containing protein [bacterium]
MEAARDEHADIVRRLESFSDIVIGFALAQTALTLVIPPNPSSFYTHPLGILGYAITFTVIARFWWDHAEIFRHYFVPSRLTIALNFAALAALGLFVFSLQLWLHPNQSNASEILMAKGYIVTFAVTNGLMACLRLIGAQARAAHLTPERRKRAFSLSVRTLCVAAGSVAGAFTPPIPGLEQSALYAGIRLGAFPAELFIGIVGGMLAARIAAIVIGKRDWGPPAKA